MDPADAADAKYHMDGQVLLGRELTVVFAEENRKKPQEMRARERGRSYDYRRSPRRRSRSPRYARTYSRSPDYTPSPRRRRYSRFVTGLACDLSLYFWCISFPVFVSYYGLFHYNSGQSHQETKGIGDGHTLDPLIDHLMDLEALVEVGVTAGA